MGDSDNNGRIERAKCNVGNMVHIFGRISRVKLEQDDFRHECITMVNNVCHLHDHSLSCESLQGNKTALQLMKCRTSLAELVHFGQDVAKQTLRLATS